MLKGEILSVGIPALLVWLFIWFRSAGSPLGWTSPSALFASGLTLIYIVPALYWQFRPWNYSIPPYYEGLPIVLKSAILFAVPFLLASFFSKRQTLNPSGALPPPQEERIFEFGQRLWIFLIPVLLGLSWRLYLLQLGWQGRLEREMPTLFGSENPAVMMFNIAYYYPVCYFALFAFGNHSQRQTGIFVWILDGWFQIYFLHRYAILLFVFRSLVFLCLYAFRLSKSVWTGVAIFFILVVAVVGKSDTVSRDLVSGEKKFLTPVEVTMVLEKTSKQYFTSADFRPGQNEAAANPLMNLFDDTMYRMYDARSASAIMYNVPDVIPYFNGKTFAHILFALIPRWVWPDKPNLRDVHLITTWVMPADSGLNATGTLAEFYMNFGYPAVLAGGFVCLLFCHFIERNILSAQDLKPAWLCVYPVLAELFWIASETFSRRVSEGLRGLLVLFLVHVLIRFSLERWAIVKPSASIFAGQKMPS